MTIEHKAKKKAKRRSKPFNPLKLGEGSITSEFIEGIKPHLSSYTGSNHYSVRKRLTLPFGTQVEGNFWQTCEINPQLYPQYSQYSNCIVLGLYDFSAIHVGYQFISSNEKAFSYAKPDKTSCYTSEVKTVYFSKKTLIRSGSSAYWSGLVGASDHNLLWVMDRIYCAEGLADAMSVTIATGKPCQIMTGANLRVQSLINQYMNSHLETIFVLDMKLYGNGSPYSHDEQPQLKAAIKANVRYVIPHWNGKTYKDINDLFAAQGAEVTRAVLDRIEGNFVRGFNYDPSTRLVNVNSKYVPIPYEYIDEQADPAKEEKKWLIHVRVGCGGGKTTRARQFIEPIIGTDRHITVLIHSIALSVALAHALGIPNYQPLLENKKLLWATSQKTMSVQSIHGMPPEGITNQIFIFDEIMQGIREILTNPDHIGMAVETTKALLANIRNSSVSIFMDAHMASLAYRISSEFSERHHVRITNHYQSEVGHIEYEIEDEKVFDHMVFRAAEDKNESMILASGTAKKVVGIALALSPEALSETVVVCGEEHKVKDFLDKGIFIGDNLARRWRHYFIEPNSLGKVRSRRESISLIISNANLSGINLLYSPSIKSGISIDADHHDFKCTFNYFENFLSPPETFHQMKKRARGVPIAYNYFKTSKQNRKQKNRETWLKEITAKYRSVDLQHLKGQERAINVLLCDLLATVKETDDIGRNDPVTVIKKLGAEYGAKWEIFDPSELDIGAMPDIEFTLGEDLEVIKATMRLIIEGREEGDTQSSEEAKYRLKLTEVRRYTGLNGEPLIDLAARDVKNHVMRRAFFNDRMTKSSAEIFRHDNVQVMRTKTFISHYDGVKQSRLTKKLRGLLGVGLDGQLHKGITQADGTEGLGMNKLRSSRARAFMKANKADLIELRILKNADFPKEISSKASLKKKAQYKSDNENCAYSRPERLQERYIAEIFPQNIGSEQVRVKQIKYNETSKRPEEAWTRITIKSIDEAAYKAHLAIMKKACSIRWTEELERLDEAPAKRIEFAEKIRLKNEAFKYSAERGLLPVVAVEAKIKQAQWSNPLHSEAQSEVAGRQPLERGHVPEELYAELNRLNDIAYKNRQPIKPSINSDPEKTSMTLEELNDFWDDPENSD